MPPDLAALASGLAAAAGMRLSPDVCILNCYGPDGKMGLHQDKDEHPDTLAAGVPIVSVSIGDTAKFILGGPTRRDRRSLGEGGPNTPSDARSPPENALPEKVSSFFVNLRLS